MKFKYILLLLLTPSLIFAKTLFTVQTGNWSSANTWSSLTTPSINDTVVVTPNDTLYINSSQAQCNHFILQGTLFFRSSTNHISSNSFEINSNAFIVGSSTGTLTCVNFTNRGSLEIHRAKIKVDSTLYNSGSITFNSTNGTKELGTLLNTGSISNPANESITIQHLLKNEGLFNFGTGKITFSGSAQIQTNKLLIIDKLDVKQQVILSDSLKIQNTLSGDGEFINSGYLEFSGSNSGLSISGLDLQNNNTLHLSGSFQYQIPKVKNNIFSNLRVSSGKLICKFQTTVSDSLRVSNNGTLSIQQDYTIPKYGTFQLDSSSVLSLSENIKDSLSQNLKVFHITLQKKSNLNLNSVDTLSINGNFSGSGSISNHQVIKFCGNQPQSIKKENYKTLIYSNPSTSELKGSLNINKLSIEKGQLDIGGLRLDTLLVNKNASVHYSGQTVTTSEAIIFGELLINSSQSGYEFNNIYIGDSGSFNNQSSSSFNINGNINNNGKWFSCINNNCKYNFINNTSILEGTSTIEITKLIGRKIQNYTNLSVSQLINVDSLFAQPNSNLFLKMDSAYYSGYYDFDTYPNAVTFSKTGKQFITSPFQSFQTLKIDSDGEKVLFDNLLVKDSLVIAKYAILKSDTFKIDFADSSIFSMSDSSTFTIGHNFNKTNIQLSNHLKKENIHFHENSNFHYLSKSDKTISTVPHYGNLIIDDGSVSQSVIKLGADSLHVKGNLELIESSIQLNLTNNFITVGKDWNGPGSCKLVNSSFNLKGDGNSSGLLTSIDSDFSYTGDNRQRVKVGQYNQLILNKTKDAYSKANNGILTIDSLIILNGVFNFASEASDVNYMEIHDSVIFSSRFQKKNFNNINIKPSGVFTLDYNRPVTILKNLHCDGEFTNPRGIIEFKDTIPQNITGLGTFNFGQLKIKKNKNQLTLNADITINDTLFLDTGHMFLNNSKIRLTSNAQIDNENKLARIYGNPNSSITTKEVLTSNDTSTFNGIGIEIQSTLPLLNTKVERQFNSIEIAGKHSIKSHFNISPEIDQNLNATLIYHYQIPELNGHDENNLILWKSEDQVNWTKIESTLNNQTLTAKNIFSFSTWTAHQKNMELLDVKLHSASAIRNNEMIKLRWEAIPNSPNSLFSIQSKNNETAYQQEGNILATPNNHYQFQFINKSSTPTQVQIIEHHEMKEEIVFTKNIRPYIKNKVEIKNTIKGIEVTNLENGQAKLYDISGKLIETQSPPIHFEKGNKTGIHFIELQNEQIHKTVKVLLR